MPAIKILFLEKMFLTNMLKQSWFEWLYSWEDLEILVPKGNNHIEVMNTFKKMPVNRTIGTFDLEKKGLLKPGQGQKAQIILASNLSSQKILR